jgi:hypothetical protein
VQVLEPDQQVRFAKLGVFAPKPATIELSQMAMVWQDEEDRAAVAAGDLVDHGILQVTADGDFQLHALFTSLATGMLQAL